jgi:hypothetical protein
VRAPGLVAPEDDEPIVLSPFMVNAEEDAGSYTATATLAGTRVRTDLRDLASQVSVVTAQFLLDTGSRRSEDLLVYTTNTEVGGLYGNFSGVGNTQGVGEGRNLSAPHTNTRVRGLDSADNTRDFFLTDIPWDSYNVDRVDLQRGPNSILFGVGSPAGIINTNTMPASFSNLAKVENVLSSFGSIRNSLNVNQVLVRDLLAVRVAGLDDRTKYQQKPAFSNDKRVYGAIGYRPQLFGADHGRLVIRANIEEGRVKANRPRSLPPTDQITPWWTHMNRQVYDPAWAWSSGALIDRGNATKAAQNRAINNPWLGNEQDGITGGAPAMFFNNGQSQPFLVQAAGATTNFGRNSAGGIDRGISGYVFGRRMDIAGFNEYSFNANADNPNVLPAASKNFYKDKSLSDPSVYNFYDNLIDGPNKREWTDWTAYNVAVAQTFFKDRFGAEYVYDYQEVRRGSEALFGGSTFLSIDINTHTNNIPTEYPAQADWGQGWPNPNTVSGGERNPGVGRAYISGSGGGGNSDTIERENQRVTAYGQFYGSDFFEANSFLARLIGRNTITGLVSRDEREIFNRQYRLFTADVNWAKSQDMPISIDQYPRRVPFAVYLSDDLRNTSSFQGLNLDRIRSTINPTGEYMVKYFNSNWKHPLDPAAPGYVDPGAEYLLPWNKVVSTQSENWRNYIGWTEMPVDILNARTGDIDQLYTSASRRNERLDSIAFTYQGYYMDGMIVPTVGWRRDEIENWAAVQSRAPGTNVASIHFDNPRIPGQVRSSEGDTISWGVVVHSPKWLEDRTPAGLRLSVFYNQSENFRAENRVGFDTLPLPNAMGDSKDYGITLSTADGKYSVRATYYDTKVTDANIPAALGSNVWFLPLIEAWGTASALTHEMYWAGELPGMSWMSNYGMIDQNLWGDPIWEDPLHPTPRNDPTNQKLFAAVADWYRTMPPQYVFDGYGLPISRAAAQGTYADRKARMVANGTFNPYNGIGSIQSSNNTSPGGLYPTGTIDQQSKGYEFELTANPIPGLNIMVNAAKTTAQRTNLGSSLVNWIEGTKTRFAGPAGDIRMWWGGDSTIRKYYDDFIYQPYLFQLDANGQDAPEIRPWRFNTVVNYSFAEGWLQGVNVGGGYRWQDKVILGYQLDDTKTKLDVTRPITGASEDSVDLWVGYGRKLTEKIGWRIQLNVRNVGDSARLIPVSVNPDGTYATQRILEGTRWSLSNTLTF